jgi:hypothetical protein
MDLNLLHYLSEEWFRCLDFQDPTTLNEKELKAAMDSMEQIQRTFLSVIGYQHITWSQDTILRHELKTWVDRTMSKFYCESKRLHLVDMTATFMEYFYPSSSYELKLCVGVVTAAAIVIDDCISDQTTRAQVCGFQFRYLRGLVQPEGPCTALEVAMKDIDSFFRDKDPQIANMVIISILDYADATYLEEKFVVEPPLQITSSNLQDTRVEWCADKFAYYLRKSTGMAKFYIAAIFTPSHSVQMPPKYWISAAEELNTYINLTNDLFSFPKELLSRETTNNIPLQTLIKHRAGKSSRFQTPDGLWTVRDTIYDLLLDLINATKSIDQLLVTFSNECTQGSNSQTQHLASASPQEQEVTIRNDEEQVNYSQITAQLWRGFRLGFVGSHIEIPRYGLDSLRASYRVNGSATSSEGIAHL